MISPTRTIPTAFALALMLAGCASNVPAIDQAGAPPPAQDVPPPPNLTGIAMPTPDAAQRVPLMGTVWRLAAFRNAANETFTPTAGQAYTLQLTQDGRVAMQLYCNRGMGSWSTPDAGATRGTITFGQMASSMAACPPSPFDRMAGDFSMPVTFSISGGKLFLMPTDEGGIYTWLPQAPPPRGRTGRR